MGMNAFIVEGTRSPIGSFGGALKGVRTDDLAAHSISSLILKVKNLDLSLIADIYFGCANQAGEDNRNVARMASLLAGIPDSVPAETINRLCASGLSSVLHAQRAISSGAGDYILAGGVEHMTRSPFVISKPSRSFGTDSKMYDSSFGWRFVNSKFNKAFGTEAMGETAENLVDQYSISREDQDRFALWSQAKTERARVDGVLSEEISPINIPQRKSQDITISHDEFPKPQSTLEGLAKLKPAFRAAGTVTAGNASGLNDGSCALLLASEKGVKALDTNPLTRVVCGASVGVEPRTMGIGPVLASEKALKMAGLKLDQIDLIEINEAFSAQVLSCTRSMGLEDKDPRINPNGGAISLGHPLGMTGARLALAASKELVRSRGRYALVTMCVGVGQGFAVILERQ
jgi:3-oxoadipyl-CoA thiolase